MGTACLCSIWHQLEWLKGWGLESTEGSLTCLAIWCWLLVGTSVGLSAGHHVVAFPCGLGFLTALQLSSKAKHLKRQPCILYKRKMYYPWWPGLESDGHIYFAKATAKAHLNSRWGKGDSLDGRWQGCGKAFGARSNFANFFRKFIFAQLLWHFFISSLHFKSPLSSILFVSLIYLTL